MDTFVKDEYPDLFVAAFPNETYDYPYDQKKVDEMAVQMNNVKDKIYDKIQDLGDKADVFTEWTQSFSKKHKTAFIKMSKDLAKNDDYLYSCEAPRMITSTNGGQRMTFLHMTLTFCSMMSCLFIFYQVAINKVMGAAHPSKHLALLAFFEFLAIWHTAIW